MLSNTIHQTLARATQGFTFGLFERQGLAELITAALDETGRWHKKDCPLPAQFVSYFVLAMSLFRSASLSSLVIDLFAWMRAKAPELSLKAVTTEALVHAKKRLGVAPLKLLFERWAQRMESPPSLFGFFTWAIDGVHLTLPDTPANVVEFGKPATSRGSAAFPQMLVVCLVEASTRLVRDFIPGRNDAAERPSCEKLLKHLDEDDLLFLDRGFAAIWLFARMLCRTHFVAKIPKSWKVKIVKRFGPGDFLVMLTGPAAGKEEAKKLKSEGKKVGKVTITLRMIEYRIGAGERVRVVTDLLDPERYPALELANGYHLRWECELGYDEIKTHLATVTHGTLHTTLRCKTPQGALQELYGLFTCYNLVRELMQEAGAKHDVPPLEISFVETLQVIKCALPEFERASTADIPALFDRLLRDVAERRIDRPRRKRASPRVIKQKMSNWKLKRPGDRSVEVDFEAQLQLCG